MGHDKYHLKNKVVNLVSNVVNNAKNTDARLVNAWGIIVFDGSIWIAANGTDQILNYSFDGTILAPTVAVPNGVPTGLVVNETNNFPITSGPNTLPSSFLVCTENGIIAGYNATVDPNNAITVVDRSGVDAVYKGLTIANNKIYACDFYNRRIDVFDANFNLLAGFYFPDGLPTDHLPTDFAPFNIGYFKGHLYVTYAKQLPPDNEDDEPGKGNGYINVFDVNGLFVKRLVEKCHLNSPWGLTVAKCFGKYSGKLFVGNFGDGKINVYNWEGKWLGDLDNKHGKDIVIEGLWGLVAFHKKIFFAAGPNDEANGLYGFIKKH